MTKQVRYGDQVYIEISNLLPPPATDVRLLSSNSFLEENIFGVKASTYNRTNFRNCVFVVMPSLVDSQEDINILRSLETELDFLSLSKPNTLGQKYLKKEIDYKDQQIEMSKETLKALNEKILDEMENQRVKYGEVVILQHLESGYYLCADSAYLPHNPTFYNLRLQKERTSACYFKFFSYSVATDRSPIDYESEMKLVAAKINTVVTMGEIRNSVDTLNLNHEDDEKEDPVKPVFPTDAIRRDDTLKSFDMDLLIVGTTLESNDNNKIKLVEYCSREDLSAFKKQKKIKNGDYVRFQLDDFYLTASKSVYRQTFGLFNHNTEGYKYNFLNSIFQIIDIDQEEIYPKGIEIQSSPKTIENEGDATRFCIKHFVTGHYLSLPQENLCAYQSRDEDMIENPPIIPHFHLINSHLKNQKNTLMRNSRVSLKVFKGQSQKGEFYLESNVEKYQIQQGDMNTKYFEGFKNTEDKIKSKLKMVKKHIVGNEVVGSFFKVNTVSSAEMKKILTFESYSNALKRFMRVLQCVFTENNKVSPVVFQNELQKIITHSTNLMAILNSNDSQTQILAREFKILDVTARFLFYFFVSPKIELIFKGKKFEMKEIIKLLQNFTLIILNSTKDNELTHGYMSQYIRVYIHAIFNPSPLFANCNKAEAEDLKDHIILLLYRFLWDKDLDTLGQLNFYQASFFKCLEAHSDYSVHLLQLMNHYCKSRSPALVNNLRKNFINEFIGDESKVVKIFPKLRYVKAESDFEIEFNRKDYPRTLMLSRTSQEVQNYIIWVFKLINSIAETKSVKFWISIMNYYHEEICENLVGARGVPPKIKNEVLITLKNVHFAYKKLPFDGIPPKIQIVMDSQKSDFYLDNYKKITKDAEENMIDTLEAENFKTRSVKLDRAKSISVQNLAVDILKDEFEQLNIGKLGSLQFTLQVMKNVLQNEETSDIQSLYLIHHSLSNIIEKAANDLLVSEKRKSPYYNSFIENAETIYQVMKIVDQHVIRLAFKDAINDIKENILKANKKAQTAIIDTISYISSSAVTLTYNALETAIVKAVIQNMTEDWKSKQKIYEKAGKFDPENVFLEKRLMKALWKIVEFGNNALANATVNLIKSKTGFEKKITKELAECSLLDEDDEISNFITLASSLLQLNQIGRRIQAKIEFGVEEKEDNQTVHSIVENLEKIFLIIYDYELHLQEENENISGQKARDVFLQRFRYSKIKAKNEVPFGYKSHCIKIFYQKVLRMLQTPEIILPFVKYLYFKDAFKDIDHEQAKLGYILIMVIMNLFVHNNTANQNFLSTRSEFINIFYGEDEDLEKMTVECNLVFAEMCRDNKKLLTLSDDHLFSISSYIFIDYLNAFNIDEEKANSSEPINFIRSLPYLFASEIRKDMFNPAEFMTEKFFNFFEFIQKDKRISLPEMLTQRKANEIIELTDLVLFNEKDQHIMLDMPIFYSILKEFLEAEVSFALTDIKERVLTLHSSLTLERVTPFLHNENIEFNFELKRLTLQILENLYFKNLYKNTNILNNFEHFSSFVTVLLIDVYGFLQSHVKSDTSIAEVFRTAYFSSESNQAYFSKYKELLKTDLDNIVFFQYQSLVSFSRIWKDYIYYIICDFFGNLISYVKDFMLLNKEKDHVHQNMFEIWLLLILKLRDNETEAKYRSRIDESLKNAIIISDYVKYRDQIYEILGSSNNTKEGKVKRKQNEAFQLDLERILVRHFGEKSTFKKNCTEQNLNDIAAILGMNRLVLKRLISVLLMPETPVKDIIFILKLFRKLIEGEGMTEENKNVPIYLWNDVSPAEFKKIHRVQVALDEINLVEAIFDLLYKHETNHVILKEILLLCVALLYGGNSDLQDSFYKQFKLDYDNQIIENLARIIEETLDQFNIKQKEITNKSYFKALNFIFSFLIENQSASSIEKAEEIEVPSELKDKLALKYYEENEKGNEKDVSIDDNYILLSIILKFMQNLCEGHYLNFQEFLRDQLIVHHYKSFNIPEFLRQAYHTYYRDINVHNVEIGAKILDLLIEMEQGDSKPNVQVLLQKTFISDVCNTLNGFNGDLDLLARGFGFNSSHPKFMEVKSKALVLLKDLVERSEPADLKKISQYINLRSLVSTFKENVIAFHKNKGSYPSKEKLNKKEIWDPNLSSAFMVYFILKHLSFEEYKDEFSSEIQEVLENVFLDGIGIERTLAYKYLNRFFRTYTGSIEILQKKTNRLMKIYYPITGVFDYLKADTKEHFIENVDRSNTQTKIAELMDASDELISQMYLDYDSRNRFLGLNFNVLYNMTRFATNILGVTIAFFNLFALIYVSDTDEIVYKDETVHDRAQMGINITQCALSLLLIWLWLQTKASSHLSFKWNDYTDGNVKEQGILPSDIAQKLDQKELLTEEIATMVLELKGPYSEEFEYVRHIMKNKLAYYNIKFILESTTFIWHFCYLGICIGSIFHPVVAAFQLCDVVIRSDSVNRIVIAVTRNSRQFLWTLILLLVTVYIYTFIGFYFLHERYVTEDDDLCPDAYSCFLSNLNLGLRSGGGIGDAIQMIGYSSDQKGRYFLHTLFDLSFFIMIIILFLNLIFGMIIDAFGELRDEKNANDEDKINVCFICGLERSEYERISNFDKHTLVEHDMWQYLAYLVYIGEKEKEYATDMTDIESYVSDCYKRKDYSWFPVGRSLTLERQFAKEENEKKSEVIELKENVLAVLEKVVGQNEDLNNELKELKSYVHKSHGQIEGKKSKKESFIVRSMRGDN